MYLRSNVFGILLVVTLAGCSASGSNRIGAADVALSSYDNAPPIRDTGGPYMLGPGDRLRIKVYDDANLTGEYEVNSTGFVSIPLVGQLKAAGLTTSRLENALVARMKGKISQDPKVNIEIAAYAPFYIYGEVKKAGLYPYQPGLTVADAIATAGGLTYRANERTIYLQHAGGHSQQAVSLDVPMHIFPGDNIRVSERMF